MKTIPPMTENKTPYNTVMQVDSTLAAKWLDGNTHNRPLRQTVVDRFVRDMQAGRWRLTHQGIAFDTDSMLIDGQHRLWAVVLSGVTVPMFVFFNEPAENIHSVDIGLPRSNFDVLHLTGAAGAVSVQHLATLRAMLAGDSSCSPRMTVGEEAEALIKHHAAVDFALAQLSVCRFKGIATATIRGIIARAYYSANHGKLVHFCDVLRTGASADQEDAPIVMLWQFLVGNASAGKAQSLRRMRYAKAERALLAYLQGETLTQLRGMAKELFPLPEELLEQAAA